MKIHPKVVLSVILSTTLLSSTVDAGAKAPSISIDLQDGSYGGLQVCSNNKSYEYVIASFLHFQFMMN